MSYLDGTQKFRVFDPLHKPRVNWCNGVIQLCCFLSDYRENQVMHKRRGSRFFGIDYDNNVERDFEVLKFHIDVINSINISNEKRIELLICINGHLENSEIINYLKSIDGTVIGERQNIGITIFQRQNIGYQWGGFHDIWLRFKNTRLCKYFVTFEIDNYIEDDLWFDRCVDVLENSPDDVGFIGKEQPERNINVQSFLDKGIPINIWRDGNNNVYEDIADWETLHSSGGFYFCKKDFLQKMDDTYGCFTFSMGNNHILDGILCGEVGFSQKARALGYQYIYIKDKNGNQLVREM